MRLMRLAKQLTLSWVANAVVLAVVTAVLSGVTVDTVGDLIRAALLFGILNTIVKPIAAPADPAARVHHARADLVWRGDADALADRPADRRLRDPRLPSLFWATIIVWAVNVVLDFVPGPWRGTRRD